MDYNKLSKEILNRGKDKMDELEVYIQNSREVVIEVFNGEIDKYSVAESGGLSLRGTYNGKMGYSYTEKIDESSIDMLINEAFENSKYIDAEDPEEIFEGSKSYEILDLFSEKLSSTPMEEKIELVKNLEKEALSLDKRISSTQVCAYQEFESSRQIINTKGVDLSDKSNGAIIYIAVIAKEGEETKTGMGFRVFSDINEIDYKEIAKEAVEEAVSSLGAKSIKSDDYPVVIRNTVFSSLLQAFSPIFSSENVQKGLSLLKDKIGEAVAVDTLTIIDNPLLENGIASRGFDDEGTGTSCKTIIDKGVLTNYLYNWKTANKDKKESTGNANRNSYKTSLGIAPSNFYVERGSKSFEELVEGIDKGVYITGVAGLHSGLNPVSGDFSLSANGFEIIDGKITRPINQITMAGNFFNLLRDIDEIGSDLKFGPPMSGYFGSPSIKLKNLSISGE